MKTWFSISELAAAQGISRQTLIYYDRIGLFCPERVKASNGYRYYSSDQLDELDTIMLLKTIGLSLDEIKREMANYSTSSSLETLKGRVKDIDRKIESLKAVRTRLARRLENLDEATGHSDGEIVHSISRKSHLYTHPVEKPYSLADVSLATKECLKCAREEGEPVGYLSGAILSLDHLKAGLYTQTETVFLPTESGRNRKTITLPEGDTVSIYHKGAYEKTGESYEKLIAWCNEEGLEIISPSYEFALNDYLTTGDEREYMTRLMVYVSP